MELFSLLAKLTLDSKDFDKKINQAEQTAKGLKIEEPTLSLNDEDFAEKMAHARQESVDDMTGEDAPKLELNDNEFNTSMENAQDEYVADMTGEDAPELGLDDEEFTTNMEDAQGEYVTDMTGDNAPELGLDSTEFSDGVADAQDSAENLGSSMTGIFEDVKTALIATGIVAAISGITNMIVSAINKTTELADTIDKQSTTLGISKQKYQEWDHALKQSGGSVSELSRGAIKFRGILDDTNKALSEQNSEFEFANLSTDQRILKMEELGILTEDQAKAYRKLGVDVLDANGKIKTSEQLMEDVLLATSELTGDEQLNVINELFGRNVTGIANLVAGGKEQVKELLGEAQELGLVMSDEEIKNAVEYGDAVANLNKEIEAIQTAFVGDILPVLRDTARFLTDILAAFNPRNKDTKLTEAFEQINKQAIASSTKIEETSTAAQALIDKLAGMGDYWTLDTQGKKTWDALAAEFKKNYPEFARYVDDTNHKLTENSDTIKANIKEWEAREKAQILSVAMEQKRQAVAEKWNTAFEKNAQAEVKEAEALAKKEAAYEAIDKFLNSDRGEGYRKNLEAWDGYVGKMTDEIYRKNAGSITSWMQAYMSGSAGKDFFDWQGLNEEAESLREEASGMMTDAEEAQASLAKQEEFLSNALFKTETNASNATSAIQTLIEQISNIPTSVPINFPSWWNGASRAIGDAYIPYDNFPALLHRGEQVVTATDARRNNNSVDIGALENRIEAAIRRGMDGATVRSYLNGKDITDEVNRNTAKQVKARRFA